MADSLTLLANVHFYLGHYDISDSLNQKALTMDKQLHGDRHPDVAVDLVNLGNLQTKQEHYKEAERYFRQALEIEQSWYGSDHPSTADVEAYVGQALTSQGRYREAEDFHKHALGVFMRVYAKEPNNRVAMAYSELGRIAQKLGKLDDAETDFRNAAKIYASVNGDRHALVANELSNLGDVYRERKQYAQAEHIFRDVVQRRTEILPPDHLDVGIARIRLGDVLVGEKRYREAEEQLIAGYQILTKKSPTASALQVAREDLAAVYLALKMPEKAAQFRAEIK
jgi:serine/threonine-protein kinase